MVAWTAGVLALLTLLALAAFAAFITAAQVSPHHRAAGAPQLLSPHRPLPSPMQRQTVESTNIKSVGYDPEDEVLEVEFHSGGVYHYVGVPPDVYEGMLAARSKGRYFGDFIRLRYPYEKVR
jgi:HAMP domain-containing protein